jgi:hypothetical protein
LAAAPSAARDAKLMLTPARSATAMCCTPSGAAVVKASAPPAPAMTGAKLPLPIKKAPGPLVTRRMAPVRLS